MIKGAPDVLIGRCSKFTTAEGESQPLDSETLAKIENIKNSWSSQGRRVILLARKTICKEQMRELATSANFEDEIMHHAHSGLTLVGIVGIVDPPRDEIPSVISILRGAGIRIFMVTGGKCSIGLQAHPLQQHILVCLGHNNADSCRFRPYSTSNCSRVWHHH